MRVVTSSKEARVRPLQDGASLPKPSPSPRPSQVARARASGSTDAARLRAWTYQG